MDNTKRLYTTYYNRASWAGKVRSGTGVHSEGVVWDEVEKGSRETQSWGSGAGGTGGMEMEEYKSVLPEAEFV